MIRSLIERLAREKSFRRRLPAAFGARSLFVSPDSALGYLSPTWDMGSRQLLSAATRFVKRDDHVWDIGGNIGVLAFAAAHIAGRTARVVAVEPDPFLAGLLQRSAMHADNHDLRIAVLCAAASDTAGITNLMIAARGRASNSLEGATCRSQAGGIRFVQPTPTVTLDGMLDHFDRPAFVKIDVEGAESLALAGAERLLSECRPSFYIEVGDQQRAQVTDRLKYFGYRFYDGDLQDGCELDTCAWNTLAVPRESPATNKGLAH